MIVVAPLERSVHTSTSFILRFKRLYLSVEKNLDSICSPHRDASTEKICIFGPHCTCQSECCGEYWPITFVSTAQPLPGFAFKDGIKFRSNRLDDGGIEGNVRCEEADPLTRVRVDELPNASPQDGTNKDVRIEHDHLSGMRSSRGDAAP